MTRTLFQGPNTQYYNLVYPVLYSKIKYRPEKNKVYSFMYIIYWFVGYFAKIAHYSRIFPGDPQLGVYMQGSAWNRQRNLDDPHPTLICRLLICHLI